MKILDHRLHISDGIPAVFERSPNQSGVIDPQFLVLHYTAGASASSAVKTLTSPARKASAHLVIGRGGEITQLVDFNKRAWHAGKSSWKGVSGLNGHSIGIELSNPGALKKTPGGWRTWYGHEVDASQVVEARHARGGPERGWHTYTAEQLEALQQVSEALVSTYGLTAILGHEDISPSRKVDPGPAFPMAEFRASLLGRDEDGPEDSPHDDASLFMTRARVNIRDGASTSAAKLPGSPLQLGARVAVMERDGIWCRVDVLDAQGDDCDLEGWVHGRFLVGG